MIEKKDLSKNTTKMVNLKLPVILKMTKKTVHLKPIQKMGELMDKVNFDQGNPV